MTNINKTIHNPAHSDRDRDLALLAAGHETGWWDDHGVPAPWPDDFFDPDSGWRPYRNPQEDTDPHF